MNSQYYTDLYKILVDKMDDPNIEWEDVREMREKYGISETRDCTRKGAKFLYEFINAGWKLTPPNNSDTVITKQSVTLNADKSEISERQFYIEDESKLRDYDYLLRLHNYDPRYFEIVSARNSKWGSGEKTLYSSKITVKPKPFTLNTDDFCAMFDKLKNENIKYIAPAAKYLDGDKLLVISISDLHMNLQASIATAGNDYNCEIAEDIFNQVIADILGKVDQYCFNRIVFTIGGDMLNADNLNNTTTKGTPQSCSEHLYDAYEKLLRMVIAAIDNLLLKAPVDVIHIPGNHDETVGWQFAKIIEAYYRINDYVTVDTSPRARKYYKFGNTLLVFAHDADVKALPKIIPDEARDIWSDIAYTDVFLQHLHSEQILSEDHHMRIQRLPTISANSKWSADKGYSSKRQCKSFIYDAQDGLETVLYTTIKNKE